MPDSSPIFYTAYQKLRTGILPLIILYVGVCLFYNFIYPVMEGSDEPFHYGYVEQLRHGEGFPDPVTADENLAQYESSQAPLYYMTAAAILQLVPGIPNWDGQLELNPWYGGQPPSYHDNKNLFLHNFDDPEEKFSGVGRGVRTARLVSSLFGILAVLGTYLLAREVSLGVSWLPLAAASFVAFNPQFIQISVSVENDTAGAAFVALTLWQFAIVIRRHPDSWQRYVLLGFLIGLAAISKASTLVLVPLAAIALVITYWQKRLEASAFKRWLFRASLLIPVTALTGGWWYLRNWLLFRDWLRSSAYSGKYSWMMYPEPRPLTALVHDAPRSLLSYWADLGYSGDVRPGIVFYIGVAIMVLTAIIGLIRYVVTRRSSQKIGFASFSFFLLLITSAVLTFGMYIRLQQIFGFAWGRHLLPGISAFSTLIAAGLYYASPRAGRLVSQSAVAFLAIYTAIIPPLVLMPTYYPPRVENLPKLEERLGWNFGDVVRLVGLAMENREAYAGTDKVITLCWETLDQPDTNYAFALHLVAPDGSMVGARDSHHGLGRYPSSAWRINDVFCDQVRVSISEELDSPQLIQMVVTVYDPETLELLPATDTQGASAPTFAGWLKAPPPRDGDEASASTPLNNDVRIADAVALTDYRVDVSTDLRLTLTWRVLEALAGDYTVFVHLADASGRIVSQADQKPLGGVYPTWLWSPGEVIHDSYRLELPPDTSDRYRLLIGMYDPSTGQRLPLVIDGESVPDGALELRLPQPWS